MLPGTTLRGVSPSRARAGRIGYLVPGFPAQTHAFFWREMRALEGLGVAVDLLSTRRPPRGTLCHDWSGEAMARTTYLHPPGVRGGAATAQLMVRRAGDVRRCVALASRLGLSSARGRVRLWGLVSTGATLAALCEGRGLKHVHVHSCADAALVAMFANLLGGPSYSLTLHGAVGDYGAGQEEKWGRAAFGFVVARALLPGLRAAAPSLCVEKVGVAPMGVDLARFRRTRPYPLPGGAPVVVSCGRLHVGKGPLDLVRAVALLREQGVAVELRLVGEGPARGEIEALIRQLDLSSRVCLVGALTEEGVRGELERARLFALASHHEGLTVATMEAMAMGLPVVVTGVGGVPELVRHGVDGLLVPAYDPAGVAGAVRLLLGDPELAARMGASGAQRVTEHFHSGISAERLAASLREHGLAPAGGGEGRPG
jgi:colanic acid/amylovoran biosynthesis glycosyltransferase